MQSFKHAQSFRPHFTAERQPQNHYEMLPVLFILAVFLSPCPVCILFSLSKSFRLFFLTPPFFFACEVLFMSVDFYLLASASFLSVSMLVFPSILLVIPPVCLSVRLTVFLSYRRLLACLCICLSSCLSVCPSLYLSVCLSTCFCICLSACLSVCLFACHFIFPLAFPSVRLSLLFPYQHLSGRKIIIK